MTNYQITKRVETITSKLRTLEQRRESTLMELKHAREMCPHAKTKKWTNNDGDGQFTVERCEVCVLQKDGGLSR